MPGRNVILQAGCENEFQPRWVNARNKISEIKFTLGGGCDVTAYYAFCNRHRVSSLEGELIFTRQNTFEVIRVDDGFGGEVEAVDPESIAAGKFVMVQNGCACGSCPQAGQIVFSAEDTATEGGLFWGTLSGQVDLVDVEECPSAVPSITATFSVFLTSWSVQINGTELVFIFSANYVLTSVDPPEEELTAFNTVCRPNLNLYVSVEQDCREWPGDYVLPYYHDDPDDVTDGLTVSLNEAAS